MDQSGAPQMALSSQKHKKKGNLRRKRKRVTDEKRRVEGPRVAGVS